MARRLLPPLVTPLSLVDVLGAPATDEPPVVRVFRPSVLPHPALGFAAPPGVSPASAPLPPDPLLPPAAAPPLPTLPSRDRPPVPPDWACVVPPVPGDPPEPGAPPVDGWPPEPLPPVPGFPPDAEEPPEPLPPAPGFPPDAEEPPVLDWPPEPGVPPDAPPCPVLPPEPLPPDPPSVLDAHAAAVIASIAIRIRHVGIRSLQARVVETRSKRSGGGGRLPSRGCRADRLLREGADRGHLDAELNAAIATNPKPHGYSGASAPLSCLPRSSSSERQNASIIEFEQVTSTRASAAPA
jgi:hypothetical protein